MTRRLITLTTALIATIALALVAVLVSAAPAEAAVRHLGYAGGSGAGSGWLGDVETNAGSGVFAYCVDPYGLFPAGDTGGTGLVSSIPGTTAAANPNHNGTQTVSGRDIEKLNYALWNWGAAATNVQAAAMDAYIYTVSSSDHPGTGVDYFIDIRVPASERAAVKARYRAIADDTDAHWNDVASLSASATVTVTDAATGAGYVDVAMTPASATGALTLTHAAQTGSGATSIPVKNGDRIQLTGVPTPTHSYSMVADLAVTGPYEYEKNVHLYTTPSNDQYQRVIRHGERTPTSTSAHAESAPISVDFSPVVATTVSSELVAPGAAFGDHVTAYSASGGWYSGAEVIADYAIYGPFTDRPAPSATVPADAPVAATGSATFAGPSATDVVSSTAAAASGWYTWVWTIHSDHQNPTTQGALPAGYDWQAVFADVAESSAVPISVTISTDTVDKTVGLYTAVSDTVTVGHDGATGAWWTDGGAPVVVTLDGTAYWVAGDDPPGPADAAPASAEKLGTVSITASAPGAYPSPSIPVPHSAAGFVVWQWSVHPDARVVATTEKWGEASQITRISPPTVTTSAHTGIAPGVGVVDTAHVTGPDPAEPLSLVFEAFRQSADGGATCTDVTRVVDTHGAPVSVPKAGDYDSPAVTFAGTGTYFWVATLLAPDGSVIAAGRCGTPDETTAVLPFTVTTNAPPAQLLGEPATDVATVTGPTPPGASLVFRAYRLTDTAHPTCDSANLVFTSAAVALTGPGNYPSESATFTDAATYAWVETAYDAAGTPLAAGTCGDHDELTVVRFAAAAPSSSAAIAATVPAVKAPTVPQERKAAARPVTELAATGTALDPILVAIVAAGLLLTAAALLVTARRRGAARRK